MQIQLRPNAQRARIAIIMIWVTFGLQVASYISDFFQLMLLHAVQNGMSTLEANDTRQQILGILTFCVLIGSAVTYIQWFRRAYFNLHLLDNNLRFTEGWASGAWFVPILSLFRPYQIMTELFKETKNILSRRIPDFHTRDHSNLLGIWWALWVINNFWGNISARVALEANDVDQLVVATNISLWNCIVSIPLAILAVKVIQEYSGMEGLLATPQSVFEPEETHFGNSAAATSQGNSEPAIEQQPRINLEKSEVSPVENQAGPNLDKPDVPPADPE
ncbi:MAG: hypothetical protein RLZZ519_234 [Bacteroidota bacterium]|jgi:hypothetical protein